MQILILLLALVAPLAQQCRSDDGSAELNDQIKWMSIDEAKKIDLSNNKKPFAYVMTQPWCGACKQLKKSFREDGDNLVKASEDYHMVAVDGDDNNKIDEVYKSGGSYIPRLMFADVGNNFRPEIINTRGHAQYKYFYTNANLVATSLEENLKTLVGAKAAEDL